LSDLLSKNEIFLNISETYSALSHQIAVNLTILFAYKLYISDGLLAIYK